MYCHSPGGDTAAFYAMYAHLPQGTALAEFTLSECCLFFSLFECSMCPGFWATLIDADCG